MASSSGRTGCGGGGGSSPRVRRYGGGTKLENITPITELERDAAGRTVTRAEHKKRLAARLKARKAT
jgi:hypothetical protein